jgi:hypothetical protein
MNKRLYLLIALLLSFDTWACSCIGGKNVHRAIEKSDVVLTGKIVSRDVIVVQDSTLPSCLILRRAEYTVCVGTVYKGKPIKDTIRLITGMGHGDCGYKFRIGSDYIIYAERKTNYFESGTTVPPFLYTDICTGTTLTNRKERRLIKRYVHKR